jgi:2-aminoadipate transaminase
MFDFSSVEARNIPDTIDMPPGLMEDCDYVFSVTFTDPNAMDIQELAEATSRVIARDGESLATYPPPLGHEGLREFISKELSYKRGIEVSSENIFLSSGAGGAVQTIIDAFVDSGDVVLMDEYCYHGSLNMFLRKGARPIHVQMDDKGMIPEELEASIKSSMASGNTPKMIYTIPVYHNPTGVTTTLDRRESIVEISNRYSIPIVENESYADFRIDGPDLPPSMRAIDKNESVMYISAFTKLLGCGLRLGFGVFPDSARETLQKIAFGPSPSHIASMAVHEYLKDNKVSYVEGVSRSLKAKRDSMIRSLGEYFPPSCTWTEPAGGMMIWVELPEHADTWQALDKAVEQGVKYNPGSIFRADRKGGNKLRLAYSHNSPEEIERGIGILANVFEKEGLF